MRLYLIIVKQNKTKHFHYKKNENGFLCVFIIYYMSTFSALKEGSPPASVKPSNDAAPADICLQPHEKS